MPKKRFFGLIMLLAVIGIWGVKIVQRRMPYVDQWSRTIVDASADSFVYDVFRSMTNLGSEPFMLPFTIAMGLLLCGLYRDWLQALFFAGGTLGAHLLNMAIKVFVQRDRPSVLVAAHAEGYSFPSGHAMITFVCYGILAYFLVKKMRVPAVAFIVKSLFFVAIVLIGISRFIINVHYLTDVLAGFGIGYIIMRGLICLYNIIHTRRLVPT